jgi:hypothetical protein
MTEAEIQSIYDDTWFRHVTEGRKEKFLYALARAIEQASRRAALEEAGAFMDKRADEFAACGNHTADTMERIYRAEAIAIRALASGDKNG